MDKTFIFRDYTNSAFCPLLVNIDKNTGVILVDAYSAGAILGLSEEDIQNLAGNGLFIDANSLLKMLKSKPELRQHPFKDWFEFQILPRIIDEFNNFTPNDALYAIRDLLEEIKDLINGQR